MYIRSNIKMLTLNKVVLLTMGGLLVIFVLSPLLLWLQTTHDEYYASVLGLNGYQYWLLQDTASWGSKLYYTFFFPFSVVVPTVIYQFEQHKSFGQMLVVRGSKPRYFGNKIFLSFVLPLFVFLCLLSLNLLITSLLLPFNAPKLEPYFDLIPNEGSFSRHLYDISPFGQAFFFCAVNALTLALFSVFSLCIQMIGRFRNIYISIILPVILLYVICYAFYVVPDLRAYDIYTLIQPVIHWATLSVSTWKNLFGAFSFWIITDITLLCIALLRNRDIV